MTDPTARVLINLAEGRFEVAGSEEFVDKQMDKFRPLLEPMLLPPSGAAAKAPPTRPIGNGSGGPPAESDGGVDGYEEVFAQGETGIQILTDLPGSGKADKTVSAALLLAFANAAAGTDTTTFDEVREVCRRHGCLDSPNFASTIKDQKDAFIFGGSRRKQTLKLTVPGRKRAQQMADSLRG